MHAFDVRGRRRRTAPGCATIFLHLALKVAVLEGEVFFRADDEAAAMSEVVLMKYVIRDKLIQHRKIPSDTPALVYVEGESYAEFLYLPRAFSHMARCA